MSALQRVVLLGATTALTVLVRAATAAAQVSAEPGVARATRNLTAIVLLALAAVTTVALVVTLVLRARRRAEPPNSINWPMG